MFSTNTAITSQPVANGEVEIRPMTKADCEFAGQMNVQAFHGKFKTAVGENKLETAKNGLVLEMSTRPEGGLDNHFITWYQGKPVGYLSLKYHDSKKLHGDSSFPGIGCCCAGMRLCIMECILSGSNPPKGMCYLETIAVSGEVRGKGIGTQLMAMADREAIAHGCSRISLHVAHDNPAMHLYERSGYRRIDQISSCWLKCSVGVSTFYEMEKSL